MNPAHPTTTTGILAPLARRADQPRVFALPCLRGDDIRKRMASISAIVASARSWSRSIRRSPATRLVSPT